MKTVAVAIVLAPRIRLEALSRRAAPVVSYCSSGATADSRTLPFVRAIRTPCTYRDRSRFRALSLGGAIWLMLFGKAVVNDESNGIQSSGRDFTTNTLTIKSSIANEKWKDS